MDAIVFACLMANAAAGIQFRNDVVAVVGDDQIRRAKFRVESIGNRFLKRFETFAAHGADYEGIFVVQFQAIDGLHVFEKIDFVENDERWVFAGSDFLEHFPGCFEVSFEFGIGDVDQVYQQIRDNGFFESRLEGIDEPVGQASNETNRIGDQDVLAFVEVEPARGGVEGGEELVDGEGVGTGEGVEERRLPGIRVSNNGYCRDGLPESFGALDVAMFDHLLELFFDVGDPVVDHPAIGFELGFALAAGSGAAAALATQVGPRPGEARQGVLHAGQRDLQDRFLGLGPFGKDIDDDFLPIDDADFGFAFPVALLGGREVFVEDENIDIPLVDDIDDFGEFACADQKSGRGLAQFHDHPIGDGDVEVEGQFAQFVEQVLGFLPRHLRLLNANEQRVLDFLSVVFEFEHGKVDRLSCFAGSFG